MIEISVKVSNEEQTLRTKHLDYSEDIVLSKDDSKLNEYVEKTVKDFKGVPEDVVLNIKMVW